MQINEDTQRGAAWLVDHCAAVRPGEKVLVLHDDDTSNIAQLVAEAASAARAQTASMAVSGIAMHGNEPSSAIADAMTTSDVIFCLTRMSLAHSKARHRATSKGARYLSLPDYSVAVMSAPSLRVNFESLTAEVDRIGDLLDAGQSVSVQSARGSDIRFSIADRIANRAPGLVREPGLLGSPPDAEVNIAPLEESCEGVFVVDGSIPCREIGLLETPVRLTFSAGRVTDIACDDQNLIDKLNHLFDGAGSPGSRVLGEFGIGLNPAARLSGVMLEDEGTLGTIHFGIGSNASIGGNNDVAFHLDFVMTQATVSIDEKPLMVDGKFAI